MASPIMYRVLVAWDVWKKQVRAGQFHLALLGD
jgi:hypothetical protein